MRSCRAHDNALRAALQRGAAACCACLLAVFGCAALASRVRAQPAAEADALFQRGLSEMQAGDYAAACPHLAESYRLEPLPGALFTLAECEAGWSKAATAIEHYQAFIELLPALPAARRARFEERRRIALEKITALSASAPEITVDVAPGAPPQLVVQRDGVPLDATTYGVGKKVDPGQYVISATLAGETRWTRTLSVASGDRARVDVPWPLETPAPAAPLPEPSAPLSSPLRRWVWLSAGVAGAGLLTGAVAGGFALSKKHVIEQHCAGSACDSTGLEAADAGQRAALVSDVGFALGLAGAAVATTLLLLERRQPRVDRAQARSRLRAVPLVGRAGAGLSLEGTLR